MAYRSITKRTKGVYIQTIIQMTEPCIKMCEILFRILISVTLFLIVNNVEIDLILQSYIKIWYAEPSKTYVPCAKLLNCYPFKLQGIIRMFFQDCIYIYIFLYININIYS